jgi:phage terminase small subunit
METTTPLTPRQARFAEAYAQHHNASLACREAGYSAGCASVTGVRLLANHSVLRRIQALEAAAAEALGVTRHKVLLELQEAAALAKEKGDPAAMIAAWREIGKMCGYYAPDRMKVDVRSDVSVEMRRMEQMTDAELINLINY